MTKTLKALALLMGVACALIGLYHLVLGQWSVPGAGPASATIDSRERFYSAIFLGYGLAWIWAARQSPLPLRLLTGLTAVFLLGGIGRVISWIDLGAPHWMQIAEGAVELVLPFVFFALIRSARRPRTPAAAGTTLSESAPSVVAGTRPRG